MMASGGIHGHVYGCLTLAAWSELTVYDWLVYGGC